MSEKKIWRQGETVLCFRHSLPVSVLAAVIIIFGLLLRLIYLGSVPGGINQDEAYAGYEAYSMLHTGADSWGYSFPVYFISWGSGMNVLNSYLMLPFVAVFGLCPLAIRLPQAIVACLSLVVFYRLMKQLLGVKPALVCLFFLTICPWHIMLSRWGLESNLAPGFLLFGMYFFLLGMEDSKKLVWSALFYGLSLYTYAVIWPLVPVILLLSLVYVLYVKKLKLDRFVVLAVLLLLVLAVPLLLFLLINNGYMDEIRTRLISVPRLLQMRENEISVQNVKENLKKLWQMLYTQDDGLYWNTTSEYGLYYKKLAWLAVPGFGYSLIRTIRSLRHRAYDGMVCFVIAFLCSVALGAFISVNVNRINCIHIGIVGFVGIGLYWAIQLLQRLFPYAGELVVLAMLTVCFCFVRFYFTTYNENLSWMFYKGLGEAVEYVKEEFSEEAQVHVSAQFYHSQLLFYDKTPSQEFLDTAEYTNYPSAYLSVKHFGRYWFNAEYVLGADIYILPVSWAQEYEGMGYHIKEFDSVCVAYRE